MGSEEAEVNRVTNKQTTSQLVVLG